MSREIFYLASEMIKTRPLTGDHEACRKVLNIAADHLNGVGYQDFVHESGEVSRLWGNKEKLMRPKLLLSGHVDVVDVEGNEKLFESQEQDGWLYGRGAGDMLGFDAAMIEAYKRFTEEYGTQGVGLLLTSDEEKGGFKGVRYVIEKGLTPEIVFIPDGNFDFNIVESQKAPHHFKVKLTGPGGHASRAFEIDNPLDRLMKIYQLAQSEFHLATKKNDWASTFSLTVLVCRNESMNKIPEEITAAFSWRFPPEQMDYEQGRKKLLSLFEKFDAEIVEEEGGGEGCYTDPRANFVQDWKEIIEEVIGRKVSFKNMHGATDGRHFYNAQKHGSKNVLVTSGVSRGHHSPEEAVNIESLELLSEAIHRYIKLLTGTTTQSI